MQFRKMSLLFSILTVIGGGNSAQAALTCTLDQSGTEGANTGTAKGTLTVNTIGTDLTAANFTAWNIIVTTTDSVTLTNANSTLDLGTNPPAITSTATSLTITPIDLTTLTSLGSGKTSQFYINNGGASGQFYQLFYVGTAGSGPSTSPALASEGFRSNTDNTKQVTNISSPPASLVLPCVASSPPIPVSLDLMSNAKPEISTEAIEIK